MSRRVKAWAITLAAAPLLLAGCSSDGLSNQERADQRYRECIAAGGDYAEPVSGGIGFTCDLP